MFLHVLLLWLTAFPVLSLRSKWFTIVKPKSQTYEYETKYFETVVDHFNFVGNATFNLKYLISTKYHEANGPILFYTGNEGPIEAFAENTGFMWEHAKELKAAVVFAEHRYYGSSLPFGVDTFKSPQYFGYLTAEQALADYALLLSNLTTGHDQLKSSPVVAFGGSYGGMLAAWLRIKYPNLVVGSIASSAPVWMFPNMSNCDGFNRVATQAFVTNGSKACKDNVAAAWDRITNLSNGPSGMMLLSKMFMLCEPLTEVQLLKDYLIDFLGTIAMVNYPYEASFLGTYPPWPVSYFCQDLNQFNPDELPESAISHLATAVRRLTNYTKGQKCINLDDSTPSVDGKVWDRQTCMEMIQPMCSDPANSMFPPATWDPTVYSLACSKKYGIKPRLGWVDIQFWGKRLQTASNIVFSNGDLDPWSALGVLDNADVPHCNVIQIPSGAHHLDLRASNKNDPADVVAARLAELEIIHKWLTDWQITRNAPAQPKQTYTGTSLFLYLMSVVGRGG